MDYRTQYDFGEDAQYSNVLELMHDAELRSKRERLRRNPAAPGLSSEERQYLKFSALPGELNPGLDFQPADPLLREPGGSLNAALHQLQQQLKRNVRDLVRNPGEALTLGARRTNEENRYVLSEDPAWFGLGFVPPAARFIQVPRIRGLKANRQLPAPVRKAAGGSIAGTAKRLAQRALPALSGWVGDWAASPAPRGALSAVKPRGGNWLRGGDFDQERHYLRKNYVEGLIGPDPNYGGRYGDPRTGELFEPEAVEQANAYNSWIDNQLRRYIERDMATPQDPLDELFLRGEGHLTPEQLQRYGMDPAGGPGITPNHEDWDMVPSKRLMRAWEQYGRPRSAWGEMADRSVYFDQTVGEILAKSLGGQHPPKGNEWMLKVPRSEVAYDLSGDRALTQLGFEHVLDWLEQSGIPPSRWKSISVPQAVRATGQWNKQLAKKAEAARRATMEGLPRLKEYPSGYAWVELNAKDPKATARILKEEGDAMGHCVGGYCDDVTAGRTRILSLRDTKTGKPEATVELNSTNVHDQSWEDIPKDWLAEAKERMNPEEWKHGPIVRDWIWNNIPEARTPAPVILQIKGRFNAAPKPEMIPYVRDLIKTMGPWDSNIGDWRNAGFTDEEDFRRFLSGDLDE